MIISAYKLSQSEFNYRNNIWNVLKFKRANMIMQILKIKWQVSVFTEINQ